MIELKNLHFRYNRRENLFNDLSLTLKPGAIYGLLGRNGAGKTSLLKIISGLLFPMAGSIRTSGQDPSLRNPSLLRDLYLLPETIRLPALSIRSYQRMFSPFYAAFDSSRFSEWLGSFELNPKDRLDRISHGQRKKFLIAFGLAAQCSVLLMDEPTNGLDIPAKSAFRRLIAGEIRDDRIFVIATHQARDLENLIDNVLILENGRIVFNRSVEETARRLSFARGRHPADGAALLYSSKTPEGEISVLRNDTGDDSAVDLEALFNTVDRNPERVASAFGSENRHEG
jgi:ABC-2 type transport system ATP-binding protein